MLRATMFDTVLEVEVSGSSIAEFADSLGELRRSIPASDREFNSDKKVWVVKNVYRYVDVPFVRRALEDREKQLSLF